MNLWMLLVATIWHCVFVVPKVEAITRAVTLDAYDKFNLSWSFDSDAPDSYITFTITCETTGWVGIGFSSTGSMEDADMTMAWVTNNRTELLDMFSDANGVLPVTDSSQDVTIVSGSEIGGITTVSFKRYLNTCDKEQDRAIKSSTTRLIWAYGDYDPENNIPSYSGSYHTSNRGAKSLYLLESAAEKMSIPDDVLHYDMTNNDVAVPTDDTTYYCSFFNLPSLDKKHHVVGFEPLIQSGNEALVHHIILYSCWNVSNQHIKDNDKTEGLCWSENMPEFEGSCRNVFVGWGIGGEGTYYPEEAGFPIGASDGSTPEYFMMEVHYDNPGATSSLKDSSGLRLLYTPTLRPNDAAMIQTGTVGGIVVPPNPIGFRTTAYCDSSCTQQWIPEGGVKVFNYMLHSHLLGVAIKADLYRDGKHYSVFAEDEAYDFNYQEMRTMKTVQTLLPGDALKITCTYTDVYRDDMTFGGLGTKDEMCLGYFSYYPKQKIANCESFSAMVVDPTLAVYSALGVQVATGGWPPVNFDALRTLTDWTADMVALVQDSANDDLHYSQCSATSEEDYPTSPNGFSPSSYPTPPATKDNTCENRKDGDGSSTTTDDVSSTTTAGAAAWNLTIQLIGFALVSSLLMI